MKMYFRKEGVEVEVYHFFEDNTYANKHGITQDNYLWVGIEAGPEEVD